MHAYLYIGDSSSTEPEIEKALKSYSFQKLQFEVKKISDVRELISFTNLGLSKKTGIVIKNIDEASVEAQNAFLKRLEEPQKNITWLLSAKNEDKLLDTIVSRCRVVRVSKSKNSSSRDLSDFFNLNIDEKFNLIERLKNRDEAKEFLELLIEENHPKLSDNLGLAESLDKTDLALTAIKTNGNVQLQLTKLVVYLDYLR